MKRRRRTGKRSSGRDSNLAGEPFLGERLPPVLRCLRIPMKSIRSSFLGGLAAVLLALPGVVGAQTLYSHGDPSADEQYMLELLNRARANPAAEGSRLGQLDFGGYAARPPLAFNANLNSSARSHNDDMTAAHYFSHTGSDGSTSDDRIRATGYVPGADGENIAYGFPTALATFNALMIDTGIANLGHRRNFLEFDAAGNFFREIGIAAVNGGNTTQDFGYRPGVTLVCGVAYRDGNHDGFYTQGEGLGGIRVTSPASSQYTVTSASGGYALPMDLLPDAAATQTTVTFTLTDGTLESFVVALQPSVNVPGRIDGGRFDNAKIDLVVNGRPAFFSGETALGSGVYFLRFHEGNSFGYYSFLADPHFICHFDLGYEYVFDAADGKSGVYLYDFKSGGFFYTSPSFAFPYLYDFKLNTILYYYPDPGNSDHYNTNGIRYFYRFDDGQIISK